MIKPRPYKVQQQGNYRRQPRPMYTNPMPFQQHFPQQMRYPPRPQYPPQLPFPYSQVPPMMHPQCHTTPMAFNNKPHQQQQQPQQL
jgi:hypothetical protein